MKLCARARVHSRVHFRRHNSDSLLANVFSALCSREHKITNGTSSGNFLRRESRKVGLRRESHSRPTD